jgi:LacI family transcriptional regulator
VGAPPPACLNLTALPWPGCHADQRRRHFAIPHAREVPLNLEDIARLAGVSRSTVSRVINDDSRVSDAVRARVKAVIAEHNYHPNAAARSLASRRSRVIGLLIPVVASRIFSDPWFPVMIQGCMDGCQEQDLSLMLLMESETDPDAADRLIARTLRGHHLDGVVIATSLIDSPSAALLSDPGFPHVVIGRVSEPDASWIDIDNIDAAYRATQHLLAHGRRRAAMLAGPPSLMASIDRIEGFRRAADEAGVPATIHHASFDQREAYEVALQLLTSDTPPDAIFAASDVMAVGIVQAARHAGCDIPRNLGLMGFDDIQPDRTIPLGISSVRQPARELGQRAVALLNDRVTSPDEPHRHEWLSTQLIIRTSCGCHDGEASHPLPTEPPD